MYHSRGVYAVSLKQKVLKGLSYHMCERKVVRLVQKIYLANIVQRIKDFNKWTNCKVSSFLARSGKYYFFNAWKQLTHTRIA